ncbi:transposase [Nocardia terpenica]|uniref:transposase n=1 Tax=Nocardia terpenica TaxID=455432 RepID=UPI003D160490
MARCEKDERPPHPPVVTAAIELRCGGVAGSGRGTGSVVGPRDRLPARPASPLLPSSGQGPVDRLQGPPDRDLRRRYATGDRARAHHPGARTGRPRPRPDPHRAGRPAASAQRASGRHRLHHPTDHPPRRHRARRHHHRAGPRRPRAGEHPGFAKEDFLIDWQARTVTCPQGVTSPPWKPTVTDQRPGFSVLFRRADCRECAVRRQCTGNVDDKGRHLLLLPRPLQQIQSHARTEQKTAAWQQKYAMRAGCEATVSEAVHAHGLRRCRYRGLARTHVQHVLTAAGTDLIRLSQHSDSPKPKPPSRFHQLCRTRPTQTT